MQLSLEAWQQVREIYKSNNFTDMLEEYMNTLK